MTKRGIAAVREHLAKLPPSEALTFEELRVQYDRVERAFPVPLDVKITVLVGPPGEWLEPPDARPGATLLYLQGGGYVIGSPRSHRHLGAAIAAASGAAALLLDYRRAPAHPFPAALEDAVPAYRWLLAERGVAPASVAVAGDSAGAGLTVATLLAARATGLAERARVAGVEVTLEVWPEMVHVWHWFLPMLDEAAATIDRIGAFVRSRVG